KSWVVAMVGPETKSSAIRSRASPARRNRPSGPVVVVIVVAGPDGVSPSPGPWVPASRARSSQPDRLPSPACQTPSTLTWAPATGRPSRSRIGPSIGGPASGGGCGFGSRGGITLTVTVPFGVLGTFIAGWGSSARLVPIPAATTPADARAAAASTVIDAIFNLVM